MSTAAIELRPTGPARLGQATAIEQSRAVAEVHAAIVVAQQVKRSTPEAIRAMEDACRQQAMADRAFFRYRRGDDTITGPSVHLARELARCWGNIQYGITELERDDSHGQSQMQAWAWDVQTNTRSSNTFIVPHKRDTKKGSYDLTQARDIYENNANNAARRLREAVFAVLPVWFREQAIGVCNQTIEDGGGKPLAQRIADAVKAFEQYKVTPGRIAAKYGHGDIGDLTAHDVGQLGVVYESIRQGTVTVDDEFPAEQDRVTAADITGQPNPPSAQPKPPQAAPTGARRRRAPGQASPAQEDSPTPPADTSAGEAPSEDRRPAMATGGQVGMIGREFERLGYDLSSPDDQRAVLRRAATIARCGDITDLNQLTQEQADGLRETLTHLDDVAELEALLESGEVASDG